MLPHCSLFPYLQIMGWLFEEDHVSLSVWVNGRLNILTGVQVTLVQSIPVIWYLLKRVDSYGEKKREEEGGGEALEYVFQCCIIKKTWALILGCSWFLNRYEDVLRARPSVQERKGKAWNPEPLCSHSSWGGRQRGRARTSAVSYKIMTVSLHGHRNTRYICFMHFVLFCFATEFNKKENLVLFLQ